MKELVGGIVCLVACLVIGVFVGYYWHTPEVIKTDPVVIEGVPVKITAVDGVSDLRTGKEPRNAVNAVITFDQEVPNGYGLLVVDGKGGKFKIKLTDNHGPGFKWGGPVTKLNSQWTPKAGSEPTDLVGCTARFYSSDFPPEVLRDNVK